MLNLPSDNLELNVANSVDFMVERVSQTKCLILRFLDIRFLRLRIYIYYLQLDTLDRNQLASRLTLNCTDSYVEPQKLKDVYVTIMDVSVQQLLTDH